MRGAARRLGAAGRRGMEDARSEPGVGEEALHDGVDVAGGAQVGQTRRLRQALRTGG